VKATAGTFPADFTVAAVQGPNPAVNAGTSIQRYWTLTSMGVTADLTFQYRVGDVMGNVETNGFYVVTPGLANYSFSPENRSFSLMGNKNDAVFTASASPQSRFKQ
jgi:hypothetical protein